MVKILKFRVVLFMVLAMVSTDLVMAKDTPVIESGTILRSPRNAKPPSVPTAPLDPNQNLHNTMDEINSILGTLGSASSQAIYGTTGVGIDDCALDFQDVDLTKITCAQFIEKLSNCDSVNHLKPLLEQAKNKYKNKKNSRAPCFSRKGKNKHG